MNGLALLIVLLFGAQEASALMLDSVPVSVAVEKPSELIQVARVRDDLHEHVSHVDASEFYGHETAKPLGNKPKLGTLQTQGKTST